MFYLCFCINIYIYTGVHRFPCQMMFNSLIVTRRMSLVGQELITLPKHTSSPPVVSGARVTRSLVFCVCFVIRCLSFCPFTFDHCVVCPLIYWFWLPLWYLQTVIVKNVLFQGIWLNEKYGLGVKIIWGIGILSAGQSSTMTVNLCINK
jgi:hypothetical protein